MAAIGNHDVDVWTETQFKLAYVQHFLGFTETWDGGHHHVSYRLSWEQLSSPDGTTEGQVTWYDYAGKDSGSPDMAGATTISEPSVIARVLPDGSTWYQYFEYNAVGLKTLAVETYSKPTGGIGTRTNYYEYAANGVDLVKHIGPDGALVGGYAYDSNHQVLRATNALLEVTYYTYHGDESLTSIKIPTGLTTTNFYYSTGSSAGRLEKTIDVEILRTNSYTYANGLVASHTDERGLTTVNAYDDLSRLIGVTYPDGTTISNKYTYLDITGAKDRLNQWSYASYNGIRQKLVETNANGVVTGYNYCQCGALYAVTNAFNTTAQMVTRFDYDLQGHRTVTYLPDATITSLYDALGRVVTNSDAWGSRTFSYNNQGLRTNTSNAFGTEQGTIYDIEDRPVAVTDANQVTVNNTYDLLGRLLTRTYPDGGVENFGYSAQGLIAYTNQLNYTNFYGYDEALRKTVELNADGQYIRYTNNAAGDLLSLTDGKGQVTRWSYDEYGRVTNKLDQTGGSILQYLYDPNSRLTNRWTAAKGNTRYKYDHVGNLTNIVYATSPAVKLAYDPLNRLTNMVDAVGTTKYTYTSGGELFTEDGPYASDTVTNLYSNRLRTGLGLQQPSGYWTNGFGYDAAKRLAEVISPAGEFDYSYVPDRQRLPLKVALPNGSYITNRYDDSARLLFTKLMTSTNTTLDAAIYGYNAANQRTAITNAANQKSLYGYDPIGQLKSASGYSGSEARGYVYDSAWNVGVVTNGSTPTAFSVDGKNQLTGIDSLTFGYDLNGNLTNVSGIDSTNLVYDDENRLVQASWKANYVTFAYDGLSRLREQISWFTNQNASSTNGGGGEEEPQARGGAENFGSNDPWEVRRAVYYVYDGNRVIQERDTNNAPVVSYTRGNDLSGSLEGAGGIGGLLARTDNSSSTYYHADGNGNITYLETSAQGLAASYRYDPFGNLLTSSGSLADVNTYRFSSKEWIPTVNSYYYLYRFYVPALQRWLNRDPIGENDGANLYRFCKNSPILKRDAFGLIDTVTDYLIYCSRTSMSISIPWLGININTTFKPADFARCICLFAPDSEQCEKKLAPCFTGKMDLKTICTCTCQQFSSDAETLKECIDNCKAAKQVKDYCKDKKIEI